MVTWDGELRESEVREKSLLDDVDWDEDDYNTSVVEVILTDPTLHSRSIFGTCEYEELTRHAWHELRLIVALV